MSGLKALIFDVDGTLAETEETHRRAFNKAFADFGVGWSWDAAVYRRLLDVAGGRERIRAFVESHDPARLGPGFDDLLGALHKRKTAIYTSWLAEGAIGLRPGIARLLIEARVSGVRLAVATTTSRANVEALLAATAGAEGASCFELMLCGEDVARKKPDPEVYALALDRLGLPASACLAIEDSVNGLLAARAVGLGVVVTESEFSKGDDFAGALAVLPDLSGVSLAQLGALHSR